MSVFSMIAAEIKALLKSPGGWFFASNAVLYTQTRPVVAAVFLTALILQRLGHYRCLKRSKSGFWGLIVGSQGILAVNALMTLVAAMIAVLVGNNVLALSGIAFGAANLTQSFIYSETWRFSNEKNKHWVLAGCEFAIAFGLAWIAVNAGYSVGTSFGLVIPVVVAGVIRSFRSHWLPSGFAYADMIFLSLLTGYEAFMTGNLANAFSRVLVLFGLTRLAVLRARNEGKISLFEVERYFP